MSEKTVVVALGHKALGTTLPEQKLATKETAKVIADLVEEGTRVVISHSNGPQVGMIHTAMNEFGKAHPDFTFAPMSVCSAMSQGYIGYDLQNAIRAELISRGIYKPVATVLTRLSLIHTMMPLANQKRSSDVFSPQTRQKQRKTREISLLKLHLANIAVSLQLRNHSVSLRLKLYMHLQMQNRS